MRQWGHYTKNGESINENYMCMHMCGGGGSLLQMVKSSSYKMQLKWVQAIKIVWLYIENADKYFFEPT